MPLLFQICVRPATIACLFSLFLAPGVRAAMDPRFELDPKTLSGSKSSVKPSKKLEKRSPGEYGVKSSTAPPKGTFYTVKPGDHLFKILMRDYGLSNSEADSFIEEIKRENNIYDIKRLRIGQRITIPPVQRRPDGSLKLLQSVRADNSRNYNSGAVPEQSLKLASPVSELSGQEVIAKAQNVLKRIVPLKLEQQKPISIQTPIFSLTLDPEHYPSFARMDGGRIILDQHGSIPPLVKALIEGKDSSVRIVSEPPLATKRFMGSILEAAGFYSVEDDFVMEFGFDPKLTVKTDFKIEKNPDSFIKQDVDLINSNRVSLPPSLKDFLKKEGYSVHEPFALLNPLAQRDSREIHYISAKKQGDIVKGVLSAFSVSAEKDRLVDVFAADNNGITLSIKADLYFIRNGQRYIITNFDGDPVNYTLYRILETKGYNVIMLEARDGFRRVSEKIISRMKIKGVFAQHGLLQETSAGYSLQISGFKLDDALLPGGGIFMTDRAMDRVVRDIFTESGFTVSNR